MRHRGFLLVTVLFLCIMLMIMGMGYVGSLAKDCQSTFQATATAQARAMARAGLEEARQKLEKDPFFPPAGAGDQNIFTYGEDFLDMDGVTVVGSYQIGIDVTYRQPPFQVIRIISTGQSGPRSNPGSQSTVVATLNLSTSNPATLFRYMRWEDQGSY